MTKESLTEKLSHARSTAESTAALEHLKEQRQIAMNAGRSIDELSSLDAIVFADGDKRVLVVPLPSGRDTAFYNALYAKFDDALSQYGTRGSRDGLVTYALNDGAIIPGNIGVGAGLITIDLNITEINSGFPSRKRAESAKEMYVAEGDIGEKIVMKLTNSSSKYGLIPAGKDSRRFFPGYKVEFKIQVGERLYPTHITSASKGTPTGALAGTYMHKGIKRMFSDNPGLNEKTITLEIVDPGKVYKVV